MSLKKRSDTVAKDEDLVVKDDAKDFARIYLESLGAVDADLKGDKNDEEQESLRPARLGIGAKFIPHNKSAGFSDDVAEKLAKRITKGARPQSNDHSSSDVSQQRLKGQTMLGKVQKGKKHSKYNQEIVDEDEDDSKAKMIQKKTVSASAKHSASSMNKGKAQLHTSIEPTESISLDQEITKTEAKKQTNQKLLNQSPKKAPVFPSDDAGTSFIPFSATDEPQKTTNAEQDKAVANLKDDEHTMKGISSNSNTPTKKRWNSDHKKGNPQSQHKGKLTGQDGSREGAVAKERKRTKTRSRMKNLRRDRRGEEKKPEHLRGAIIQPKLNRTRVIPVKKTIPKQASTGSHDQTVNS
eukprot:TRINITY_DN5332_c0_g1_i3.p1 TRINITY_DN5332_c0_g1~~TRINITY_DN5332_c0_g1_i3.p1  ORF type:complete len:353 (-),score=106.91 TRINITY_DN5332_c0_g1_i3:99-1157(-)